MSESEKEALITAVAERLQSLVEPNASGKKKKDGLTLYRWVVMGLLISGGGLAGNIWTMMKALVSVPAKVETIDKSVTDLRSTLNDRAALVDKHAAAITELQQFKQQAVQQLDSISKTVDRIDQKMNRS